MEERGDEGEESETRGDDGMMEDGSHGGDEESSEGG